MSHGVTTWASRWSVLALDTVQTRRHIIGGKPLGDAAFGRDQEHLCRRVGIRIAIAGHTGEGDERIVGAVGWVVLGVIRVGGPGDGGGCATLSTP